MQTTLLLGTLTYTCPALSLILLNTMVMASAPWLQNLETARAVEGVVRQHGATPATIAILGGVPHIGLTDAELESLASRCQPSASSLPVPATCSAILMGCPSVC